MTEDLIETYLNCNKLMPLLHLPVQSGSSKILKLMNRKHNIEEYLDIIKKLRKKRPSIRFSSDFIIGYPGEDDKDFDNTLSLMKDIEFINSYSFIFSPRPGTPASNLDTINLEVSKKRLEVFQETSEQVKKNYRKKLLNKKLKVLFENKVKEEDKYFGRDEYGDSVIVKSKNDLKGKNLDVKVNNFNQNTIFGEIAA
tara:strand:- start:2088 stop:2678 length:591 start_codon:yes stop_codon:yes gene_type:complete